MLILALHYTLCTSLIARRALSMLQQIGEILFAVERIDQIMAIDRKYTIIQRIIAVNHLLLYLTDGMYRNSKRFELFSRRCVYQHMSDRLMQSMRHLSLVAPMADMSRHANYLRPLSH